MSSNGHSLKTPGPAGKTLESIGQYLINKKNEKFDFRVKIWVTFGLFIFSRHRAWTDVKYQ